MKDQFLYSLRREKDEKLARKVYREIAALPARQDATNGRAAQPTNGVRQTRRRRTWAFATVALLVTLVISAFTSPGVRAFVEDIVRQVGALTVRETALYPVTDDTPLLEPSDHLSLAQARKAVDFTFELPTALPQRYEMLDEVIVTPGFNSVHVRWRNAQSRGDWLALRVSPANPEVQQVVGSESVEEIEVNGMAAIFVRGGWLENTKSWDPDISREVRWTVDGVSYGLSTGGQFSCPDEAERRCPLSDEDLQQIAASITH